MLLYALSDLTACVRIMLVTNIMVKFTAQAAGIPFLDPYLNRDALFFRGRGENFAVAGSTALPTDVLAEKNISSPLTGSSLTVQLDWMLSHFNGICYSAYG